MVELLGTRVGRLLVGGLFMLIVTSFSGFSSLPVASKHKDPPCTATATGPAPSTMTVTDAGLTASTAYSIFIMQPNGNQYGDVAYTDAAGNLSDSGLPVLYSGSYSITITKFKSNAAISTCSVTVG